MSDIQIIAESLDKLGAYAKQIAYGSISVEFVIHGNRITKANYSATEKTVGAQEGAGE